MDRALTLGWAEAQRVGIGRDEVVLPVVEVDPGLRSGQVVFVRWPKPTPPKPKPKSASASAEEKPLSAAAAHPWLMVSVLLGPDGVVDVELLSGDLVEPSSPRAKRVEVLLVAARALPAEGRPFRMFAVEEVVGAVSGPGQKTVTRVYALSSAPTGPDLELVVDKPRRRDPLQVVQKVSVHAAGAVSDDRIVLESSWPAAATVVRALQRGSEQPSQDVLVSNAAGLRWTISTQDGRIAREASGAATDVKP